MLFYRLDDNQTWSIDGGVISDKTLFHSGNKKESKKCKIMRDKHVRTCYIIDVINMSVQVGRKQHAKI